MYHGSHPWRVALMFGSIPLPRDSHAIYLFIYFLKYNRLEPKYRIIFNLSLQIL